METIKWAAIKRNDGVIAKGKNHAVCILESPSGTCKKGSVQGFLTSEGRFVTRQEAAEISFKEGQNKFKGSMLTSEEIYIMGNCYYDEETGYEFKPCREKK